MSESNSLLSQVQEAYRDFSSVIRDSMNLVLKKDISKYPIYILSVPPFPDSTLLAECEGTHGFSLYVSTTEDFIRKGIIPIEKAKAFISTYKPTDTHCCLFVVPENPTEARFIFNPLEL
ncbi:MAG: hypothetical protein ACO3AF_02180 [Flavobacteriales bacterium]|jgi:hypothetical protein|nr:hypothetical protein [Bacteroidota bacterium]